MLAESAFLHGGEHLKELEERYPGANEDLELYVPQLLERMSDNRIMR